MGYDLLSERWIPVLRVDGRWERVGIVEALREAGSIREIAASNPMDRVALLRFLLAVLYWCRGNPQEEDKDRILADGTFPEGWFGKLEERRECFDLLGDGKRFCQDVTATRARAVTDLLQEIPTGNNFWHFRHSTDAKEGLCIACCAMGLLRLPLFSVSGLPDLKAGINGTPPIYVVPVGRSLLQTLCLNWVSCRSIGTPVWEKADASPSDGNSVPLLNGLTMLSRRVWLHEPILPGGVCIGCGMEEPVIIRTCEYQSAGDQHNPHWDDPHVVYTQKKTKEGEDVRKGLPTQDATKSYFRMDKPWASLFTEVASSTKFRRELQPVRLLVVGFATDKAKNIDVWERTCVIPPRSAAGVESTGIVEAIDVWNEEGRKLAMRMKPKGSKSHGEEFTVATTAIRPHVESRVSADIADLLANPAQSWPRAVDEYRQMISVVATSLAPGFTTRAIRRRNEIAGAVPNMAPRPTAKAQKPKAKKGGDK